MSNTTTPVKTLPMIARELGVDRSTLVRLEQKGIIDTAPVMGAPVQGRVYSATLEAKVKRQFEAYRAKQAAKNAHRPAAPVNPVIKVL